MELKQNNASKLFSKINSQQQAFVIYNKFYDEKTGLIV